MLAERPENYRFMITRFIEIDNSQYERKFEKKGRSGSVHVYNGKGKKYKTTYPREMEIDATHRPKKFQRKRKKNKSQITCYQCEKKGHYKNECKQLNGTSKAGKPRQLNVIGRGSNECNYCKIYQGKHRCGCITEDKNYEAKLQKMTTRQKQQIQGTDEHRSMTWTTCYDSDCEVHMSEKMGQRWFPKRPKKEKDPREKFDLHD